MTFIPNIPNQKTAFGELLVGQVSPIFQGSFEYTVDNTELNTNTVVNGGTVTQADAMAVCTTTTTTGRSAELKSTTKGRYRAGIGGLNRFTALFSTPIALSYQLIGIADEIGSSQPYKNGLMVGYVGTVFGVHRFKNDTITTVVLADCDDPLDGNGASGMTYVPTNLNVFQIRYQYLGAGRIEFWIEDDSTGEFVLLHTVLYANLNTTPSTYSPNYRFTMFVNNLATTTNLVLKCASYAYFVEGLTKEIELHQPQFSSDVIQKTAVTTETALFTIRNKTTYASKANFIDILLELLSVSIEASSSNNLATVRIVKNATLGGTPSYADIQATNSVMEIDVAGTTVTGGKSMGGFQLAGKNDKIIEGLLDYKIYLESGEWITIAVKAVNQATFNGNLLWKELF